MTLGKITRPGKRAGQTMLELIVAVYIVLTALGGIATMVIMSVRGQERSEETVIAYNLAREGVEIARALRDNTFTTGVRRTTSALCTNCANLPLTTTSNDHFGIVQMDVASGSNPFGYVFNYSGSTNSYTSLAGNIICQSAGGGMFYQRSAGCVAGDTSTRFRRHLALDIICLDPNTQQECVTGPTAAGCPGAGAGACAANFTQFIGHRVKSGVYVFGRRGGNQEVVELVDYLYVWK